MTYQITPLLHPLVKKFCKDHSQIINLVQIFGSPLNILFPQIISDNLNRLHKTLRKYDLSYKIFYSCKPNRSKSLRKQIAGFHKETGIDVSSAKELEAALASGFHSSRIQATGPKNADYLFLAYHHQVLINIDNWKELELLKSFYKSEKDPLPVKIMCRLDIILAATGQTADSVFGFQLKETSKLLVYLKSHQEIFDFKGFSFHLNEQNLARKIELIETSIIATQKAREMGLKANFLNIGGGLRIQYCALGPWKKWKARLFQQILDRNITETFSNHSYGLVAHNGELVGNKTFTEHARDNSTQDDIDDILFHYSPVLKSAIYKAIKKMKLTLLIEPGLALHDQAGITLASVSHHKKSIRDEHIVFLNMNRTNINAVQFPYMVDPLIIHRPGKRKKIYKGLFLVGNLCVSHDMLMQRRIYQDKLPDTGDIVIFTNTAGYRMDFDETPVLEQVTAKKIAVHGNHKLSFCLDECYLPLKEKFSNE